MEDDDEWLTPAEERKRAKDKKREENRRKFQQAKEQSAKQVKVVTARQPIGTKVGNKQRMLEFKEKLLTDHNGTNIIRKVMEIALNDEHPGQVAALKMAMDRILPTSMFEEMKKGGDKPSIQINISGLNEPKVTGETIEGEVVDD